MITKSLYAKAWVSPWDPAWDTDKAPRCRIVWPDDLLPFYITLTHHRWGAFLLGLLEEKIVSYPFFA